ncbi:MAG TPA: 4-alpha-glucanotransferase [Solirubrobacteraceae bacterium]|nr:4-alpha-glucanotransferase [Solirubrobacteraceae bacterium]
MKGLSRTSGVQLHVTSLPGGRLGREAYRFVDWLAAAGQSWWQLLPLGPPDRHRSPYKARSAFAAWPALLGQPRARVSTDELSSFRERERAWILDWERFAGPGAAADQIRFQREWGSLRAYAAERRVRLIGDVAIYVAPDSADHRAHPELFREGMVAGAPPDSFSADGQLWGNPVYDWPALQRRGYRWWTARLQRTLELFDLVRIDHFRGFVAYWAVPAGARTARSGRWRRGPGRAVFDAISSGLGVGRALPLIAEDLGVITPPVHRLRDELGLPGMLVLQFGFDPTDPHGPHRPENHVEHRVIYTGTHDQDTLRGWWDSLDGDRRSQVRAALDERAIALGRQPWWALIRLAMASPARLAMMQAQDVLGLGSEARMNYPSRATGNWGWQLRPGQLTRSLAARLREATEEAGRTGG